ncbi:hypothetical protein AURDEDRAFT_168383 [Auricularia subglabra TFB-10046 SS5]|nr:hypothetical protein AURDEDRAFT_168383 [Auricularia subglabra TFB-10046 SS5]
MTMRARWPALAAYFGLVDAAPDPAVTRPGAYAKMHAGRAENWKGEFLDTVGDYLSFDRQVSLDVPQALTRTGTPFSPGAWHLNNSAQPVSFLDQKLFMREDCMQ